MEVLIFYSSDDAEALEAIVRSGDCERLAPRDTPSADPATRVGRARLLDSLQAVRVPESSREQVLNDLQLMAAKLGPGRFIYVVITRR
ncbi:MAG: hypothetical protein AB7L71_00190 [Vicinamibacterales bacterium]